MKINRKHTKITQDYGNVNNTTRDIFVNQCFYDIGKPKRATCPNMPDGTPFFVVNSSTKGIVFHGKCKDQVIDFSLMNDDGIFYIECGGRKSYKFKVGNNALYEGQISQALLFMEQSRQDAFDVGHSTGYAWRDSHQFSFEIQSLIDLYTSNKEYFDSLEWNVYKANECEYQDLRVQKEPNIVWLIKFAIKRYYEWNVTNGIKLHALIKAQVADFLYHFDELSEWFTEDYYNTIKSWLESIWEVSTTDKSWYDEFTTQNLLVSQSSVGTPKGAMPVGYGVIPNFQMYSITGEEKYLNAGKANIEFVCSLDFTDGANTKGQRMSEYVCMDAMMFVYEKFNDNAPEKLFEKIEQYTDAIVSNSDNLWDFRKYDNNKWIYGLVNNKEVNECGNVLGLPFIIYRYLPICTNKEKKERLEQIAISAFDNAFGRNPTNRCFCYTATSEFDGADKGWVSRYNGGAGNLTWCNGVIDGSPKSMSYPYNPNADTGYTEGWVAFNTNWNRSLAQLFRYYNK